VWQSPRSAARSASAADRLGDDLGSCRPYPGQRRQRAVAHAAVELAGRQALDHGGGAAERLHPVRRRPGPFQQEGDLPQRAYRVHERLIPRQAAM